jgi:8-oxo-dGTP pyrophosphatase MutT (NUDIX family)
VDIRPDGGPVLPAAGPVEVEAAGAVVWRRAGAGVEVLLVHRPAYDDWSLPKGKLDPGEDHRSAAVREVAEEAGATGRLGADLGEVRYTDRRGRAKRVRWWALEADGRPLRAPEDPDEVDERRWLPLDAAARLATHGTDRDVLARFATGSGGA